MTKTRLLNKQHNQLSAELMVQGRDLPWLLSQWSQRCPDKLFLIWSCAGSQDRQWTYQQFDHAVRCVAAGLQGQGLRQDQRLLLHMDNSPEFLLTYFACAYLGIVSVISNTRLLARELSQQIKLCEVAGVVTQAHLLPVMMETDAKLPLVIVSGVDEGEGDKNCLTASESQAAYQALVIFDRLLEYPPMSSQRQVVPHCDLRVQFTSGTTSAPKAVLSTHANALFAAQQTALGYGLTTDDLCQVFVPLFHTNGLSTLVTSTLWAGGTVLLQAKFSASHFWPPATQYGATWTCLPGAFFIEALKQQPVPEHCFRFWIVNCSSKVAGHFGITPRNHWGMTEMITLPIMDDPHHPSPEGSIGRPVAGIEVAIRNKAGKACQVGETGALYVRGIPGITLFKEYLNDPKATADSFDNDGWFITGDRVHRDEKGYLFFDGREKDLLRVGGENVAAAEIEAVIQASGWVAECAVVGQPHPMLDEVPVAFVKQNPQAPQNLKTRLIEYCQQNLADFKVIRDVYIVEDFPRATLQKIAKYQLRAQLPMIESVSQ